MTTRNALPLQNRTETASAFDRAVLSLRRPWWTTVAASVLLLAGTQRGVDAAPIPVNSLQVWNSANVAGILNSDATVNPGGHLRLSNGITLPNATVLGTAGVITILGGQLSGVDETIGPVTPGPLVVANAITIGDTSAVTATLGQKGDTQLFTPGDVTLKQNTSLNVASHVAITDLKGAVTGPGPILTVTGGDGTLDVSGAQNFVSFNVTGGKLALTAANFHTGDTTLASGELTVSSSAGLGVIANKLILLGGKLEASGIITNDTIIATDTAHATVNLADGTDLGGATNIKAGSATVVVNDTSVAAISGAISGASLEKAGKGRLELSSGANTYADSIISDGELAITAPGDLGGGKVYFRGGVLDIAAADPSRKFAEVEAGQHIKIKATTAVFGTAIQGAGGLELVSGVLDLKAGDNPYRGETIVDSAGVLRVNALQDIQSSSSIQIYGGAKLEPTATSTAESVFFPNQLIKISNGGNLIVAINASSPAGIAEDANIRVELQDLDVLNKPVNLTQVGGGALVNKVTDLRLKVRVAGTSGASALRVGDIAIPVSNVRLTVANYPLTVADYADGVAAPVQVGDKIDTHLEFLNPVFKVTNSGVDQGNGVVTVNPGPVTVERRDYSEFGAGSNGQALGHYFSQHLPGTAAPYVPFDNVHQAMDNADYSPEITNILRQLSPGAYAELARLQVRRATAVSDAIEDRVDSLAVRNTDGPTMSMGVGQVTASSIGTTPAGKGEPDSSWAAWASAYTKNAHLDASSNSGLGAVRERSAGDTFGVERRAGSAVVGLFGSTSWGRSRFEDPSVNVSTDSWHIGLYTIAPLGNVTWDASVIYGMTTNDSRRQVNLPAVTGVSGDYRAKFDSRDLQITTGLAYNLTAPESAFQTAPVLRLAYVNTRQGALDESEQNGSNAAYAAHVDALNDSSFLSKLGWKFSYASGGKDVAFGADASSYWLHDWTSGAMSTAASLKGGSGITFPVSSRKGSSDSALLNAGMQLTFSERYTTRLSVNQELGGERNETVGRATVGVKF